MQNQFKEYGMNISSIGIPQPHDSAIKHVTGSAAYIDDLIEPEGTLHLAPIWSRVAVRAKITSVNLNNVISTPGVITVLKHSDIPGINDCSPSIGDDPVLAEDKIEFYGQVIFVVVAKTREIARRAARLAEINVEPERPILSIEDAIKADSTVLPDFQLNIGKSKTKIKSDSKKLSGVLQIGGQEHFYLEGQVALAIPQEDNEILVHSSTQYPSEVQQVVAKVLDVYQKDVTVLCRRMGGGFGGKESQASQWAALSALAAYKTRKPCKIRLDRDEDMIMTGKRHDFLTKWDATTDNLGCIQSVKLNLASRCGYSADLSLGVNDRAVLHADSAYYFPEINIQSRRMRTNTCSNTAFRGFGGPQGMLATEHMITSIAINQSVDPLDVRKQNLYRKGFNKTPYGMKVSEYETLHNIVESLELDSQYRERRNEISNFNSQNTILKKGIALTPVKFGISFTLTHLNQAGALIHLYTDGTIHLNHSGTEMGQGLFTKVAQIVANVFGSSLDRVQITSSNTSKVPNSGPTAASAGTDLNGMAAKNAAETIKNRLISFASEQYQISKDQIQFINNQVKIGNEIIPLGELATQAHKERIQLSATGFYATPKITWDRERTVGNPFYYFAFGAACSEVTIDTTTGEHVIDRVDIIHDVGLSINPAIDIGQIEGGFIQGLGWLTSEELFWDETGKLRTHAPSTYKIPTVSDWPKIFNIKLWESKGNSEETVYHSKAVGEPPLMLAISVYCAIFDAIASIQPGKTPQLNTPTTPELVLNAINQIKTESNTYEDLA